MVFSKLTRTDNSRGPCFTSCQELHRSKLRIEAKSQGAIHIMGDLQETTNEVQRRERS